MSTEPYSGSDNLEVLEEAVRYNRFLVDLIVEASEGAQAALDFGAGLGTLAAAVQQRGIDVECVEPDAGLQRSLRDRGLRVHADLDSVVDNGLPFAYSVNVLEHIPDDEAALRGLFKKVSPGNALLIYVPAFEVLFSSMDEKVGHLRRYRRGTLRSVVESAGFVVEREAYADSLGFFAALVYRAVGSKTGEISIRGVRIYDRFVFPLSRWLDRLGARHLFGKNLVMLARRPRP